MLTATVEEQTNRSLFIPTQVTASALPINLVASLLEMNVGTIPLLPALGRSESPRAVPTLSVFIGPLRPGYSLRVGTNCRGARLE
jgi:hypothetical protein